MKKYKLGLAIVFLVLSLVLFGKALADFYVRTPSTVVFQNTTVNFEGRFTAQGNTDSYKIVVDGVASTCIDQEPATDEVDYDVNMSLPLGPHYNVSVWSYESNDDECDEYPHVYLLEGVTPAFTVTN